MVLTSTHNLCFEQKFEKTSEFFSENFQFLVVKFSIFLNRRVFVISHLNIILFFIFLFFISFYFFFFCAELR